MARARMSVQAATAKWQQRTQGSAQYYRDGVANPSADWQGGALAAGARRDAGLLEAINTGAIDRGIQRTTNDSWRQATLSKGVTNWTTGVSNSGPAFSSGLQRAYGYQDAANSATAGMPTTTVQQRIAKSSAYLQAVHDAKVADRGF